MNDLFFLQLALQQARKALYTTTPNPRVGCVIVDTQGKILGQGHTQAAGLAHAEIMALNDCAHKGFSAQGATAYVTLEPCAHFGRTPPCTQALIDAQVRRVVILGEDPNPKVAGLGIAQLRAAGLVVDTVDKTTDLAQQAWQLNLGFMSKMLRNRPWVRQKSASSLDGITALDNGQSQWISCEQSRIDTHHWRAQSCLIITGVQTVLHDNPRLDVRHVATPRQPDVLIFDSHLRTPLDAEILKTSHFRRVFIAYCNKDINVHAHNRNILSEKAHQLSKIGVECLAFSSQQGRIDLDDFMHWLNTQAVNEVHLEAGAKLSGSFIQEGWVDELLLYQAPKLIGNGKGLITLPTPLARLEDAHAFEFADIQPIGSDLRMRCIAQTSQDFYHQRITK